ncbi:MAG: peptidase T [Latilactobacillus curvatus]|uniref:peptidase T n=1 Tax=Latilactobacillus curvatus TaxID=28038 RepID=UPI000230F5A7|nr:peptidase T [Latilactobacillus curvatus]EHE85520.1 peptidase T [Latilactobacillus curvatus CRL 705]MBZ1504498.1 peptidase T [Latilactobacillus curvatus]MCP8850197.1 peptidase T [Latilactobacillus curvatus]MCS6143185.1 peptidase T [Latilactobacillus curvatus]MCT3359629.1 peptidase T [Latilactobacillus curvatus]
MAKYEKLIPRFLEYVTTETRSDENATTSPSTQTQVVFLHKLMADLKEIGLSDVKYNESNGYVTALLPSNIDKKVPTMGFLSHVDTADFNAKGVNPQIVENYDGESIIKLDDAGKFVLDPKEFPNMKNYKGQTLITTDGSTLLGSDDKSGVAEIMTAMDFLVQHPEIKHGDIKIGFGPDEEIGTGADHFDAKDFATDFAYTMDGGPIGQLEYETFNAAAMKVDIQGKNVHPSEAKNIMINALQVAVDFQNALPSDEVPEKTDGRQGFYHLLSLEGTVDEAHMAYIIRDFERDGLEERKAFAAKVADQMNAKYGEGRVVATIKDQYYNMAEVLKDHMDVVDLAKDAMEAVDIKPLIEPVRGGTDGSKISFMGIPTPNIFAGAENMHGRYEFVSIETMEKAVDTMLKMNDLNVERN